MPIPQRLQPIFNLVFAEFKGKLGDSLFRAFVDAVYKRDSIETYTRKPTLANEAQIVIDMMQFVFTRGFAMQEMGCDFDTIQREVASEIARLRDLELVFAFYMVDTQVPMRGRVNSSLLSKIACQMVFDIEGRAQLLPKAKALLEKLPPHLQPALIADIIGYCTFMAKDEMTPAEVVELLERLPKDWQEFEIRKLVVSCDPEIKRLLAEKGMMPRIAARKNAVLG